MLEQTITTADATAIAAAVLHREISVQEVVEQFLSQIRERNSTYNCFTIVMEEAALNQAEYLDQLLAEGINPGPLVGVPFAVKNLYAVAGLTTLAGAKINAELPPASQDATAVMKLKQAGAILLGTLNMDEYAYGFVTENSHYGATHNPHNLDRTSGGSSGGSAAAVAAGLVPFSLGSDTNGSVRVPAAFCGIWGCKPTYGRLSRRGMSLLSTSLDHVGFFARSVRDLALIFDLLQGPDEEEPTYDDHSVNLSTPSLGVGIADLRLAVAGGYFQRGAEPEVEEAVQQVATALDITTTINIPETHRARAAAYIITAVEGANLHQDKLRSRPQDFDPATRDRFLSGLLLPTNWYLQAQRFRRWYQQQLEKVFQQVDVIIAPTTPCQAPPLGVEEWQVAGEKVKIRPHLGLYTQPLSLVGLPVISLPLQLPGCLPQGVQLIAAPYRETILLRVAAFLESKGVGKVAGVED